MTKIIITRSRQQSRSFAIALESAGFAPIFFPTIQIRPLADLSALEEAITQIEQYDWVIFSSVNAVEVFGEAVIARRFHRRSNPLAFGRETASQKDARSDKTPQIAAIGPKTEASLRSRGVDVHLVPSEYVGESLLAELGDLRGKWVLLPRAKVARNLLPREIAKAGGIVHEIAIYETIQAEVDEEGLTALHSGVEAITFTSPSTVKNFVKLTKNAGLDPLNLPKNPLFACIGTVTEKAAREAGFSPIVVAKKYTTEGLIEILLKHKETQSVSSRQKTEQK